jgi:hypothetical protein
VSRLTDADLTAFIERGFCRLPAAFSRADAALACEEVWSRIEATSAIRRADAATWPAAYDIQERLESPVMGRCFSDALAAAIEQLVGPGRWRGERRWGFWPMNFSWGAGTAATWPDSSWHVDGNWFRHSLTARQQGLLVIGLFTDVRPGWGGTVVAQGSHLRTARILAEHPDGLTHRELFTAVLSEPLGNFEELVGEAGDVILAHPFLFHSRGFKRGGPPRIISNTEAGLLAPLQLTRDAASLSVLERSIVHALSTAPMTPAGAMACRF